MPAPSPHVFWICGLSGAGKSTLAAALVAALRAAGRPVLELDGDALRHGLCAGLGFSDADRAENLRRAAEVARLALGSGLCVVASFITPRESHRQLVRRLAGPEHFSLIWADAPLEVCRRRDVKGLYAKAQAGQVPQMTGIGSSFEAPGSADLVLSTGATAPEDSSRALAQFALGRLGRHR